MWHKTNKKKICLSIIIIVLFSSLLMQGCGNNTESISDFQAKEVSDNMPKVNSPSVSDDSPSVVESPQIDSIEEDCPADQSTENHTLQPETRKASDTSSLTGGLHVDGSHLTDSAGNPIQLRGISTHGLSWFPDYVNEDCFRQLKEEWNMNVIRLAMYTAEHNGYCTGGDQAHLKELVKSGVDYATAAGMYVIIDWHILSDSNPNTYKEESKTFFAEMARLYADHDNVLYEICNEPNGGTSWKDIKSYAEEVIPVIRTYDKNSIIIVGTPNWSQYVDQAAADPITGYDNIMYALHFYAATHTDSLRNTMKNAIDAGLPVFVTEYGICDASGNGSIDENQANQWIALLDKYGVSYVAWNLSNKNETSAILSAGCNKVSDFTEDDLSASGKWLYQMLTGRNAGISQHTDTSQNIDTNQNINTNQNVNINQNTDTLKKTDSLSFSAVLANSWESEGKKFYQYDLTVLNTSGMDCSQWSIDISFSNTITLTDSWNGNFSADNQTLHVTSKDYNSNIPAGSSTGNIGFIISSDHDLKVIS